MHPRFHVKLLKPYRGDIDRYDQPPPEIDDEGVPLYEVEKIVNDRYNARSKRHEWRVQWKGYSPAEATWEPIENLAGAGDILKDYRSKQKATEAARGRRRQPKREMNVTKDQ